MSEEVGKNGPDDLLIAALASGKTYRESAALAGLCERTVSRRMQDAGFRRRVEEERSTLVRVALSRLIQALTGAADKLQALLGASSEAVQLGAARTILDAVIRLRQSDEFDARIRAIEERDRQGEPCPSLRPHTPLRGLNQCR